MSAYGRSPFEIYTINQISTILDLLEEAADQPNIYMEIYTNIGPAWGGCRQSFVPSLLPSSGCFGPSRVRLSKVLHIITFIGCVLGLVLFKELDDNDWVIGERILQKLVLHRPSPTQCPSRFPRLLSPPLITQTFSEALIVRVEYNVIQSQWKTLFRLQICITTVADLGAFVAPTWQHPVNSTPLISRLPVLCPPCVPTLYSMYTSNSMYMVQCTLDRFTKRLFFCKFKMSKVDSWSMGQ